MNNNRHDTTKSGFKGSIRMTSRVFLAVMAVLGAAWTSARATVAVSPLYGSNMVIQRGQAFPVGGTAAANKIITVSYNGQTNSVTSDALGNWQLTLPSMGVQTNGSNLVIKEAGGNTLTFGNVVVGDVWLCSGQSNMGIDVNYCLENGNETGNSTNSDVTTANFPGIRYFGSVPLANLVAASNGFSGSISWSVCSPATVGSFSACAFYFARAIYTNQNGNVPIGLEVSQVGGTHIDPWLGPEGLTDIPALAPLYSQTIANYGPFSLFNGMIYPLAPSPVKGVIWYQGENAESTVQSADSYYLKDKGLVAGVKRLLGLTDCAFYVVQIASSGTQPTGPAPVLSSGGWDADTRLQQGNTINLPHAGVATAIDIGDSSSWATNAWLGWHPTNKWDVGFRLALWAMKNEYGQTNLVPSGPVLSGVSVSSNVVTCTFNYAGSGLMVGYKPVFGPAYATNSPLALCSIAGANGNWYWANATITGSNTLQLTSTNVASPRMVSYACWQNSLGANLYNSNGLPALPFYVTNITTALTVTASAGTGGTISPAGATSYLQRMTALYTITPNPGNYVQNIQVDGTNVGPVALNNSTACYTFDPIYGNHTITATFTNVLPTNTVTATASGGGTLTPAGAINVGQGGSQSFAITANPGFQTSVMVDGAPLGPRNNFTFSDLAINHTLAVAFTCAINAFAGYGGAISPPGVTNVTYGASVTYNITPAAGFSILKVTVDGTNMGAVSSYSFTNVNTSHVITASFTGGTAGGSVPQPGSLLFSCLADSFQTNSSGTITSWPAYLPSNSPALTTMNLAPAVQPIDGRPFARNYYLANADGFNEGVYASPIPCAGASVVVVAKPIRNGISGGWGCVVDAFYNQLSLGILNDTGAIFILLNGNEYVSTATIPDGQTTILSLVVQPSGQFIVWANGSPIYTNSAGNPLTAISNNVAGPFANNITLGNNNADNWSTYNGYIGDVFFYTNALSATNRSLLEQYLATRLLSANVTNYTITATAGAGGAITPVGGVVVASGSSQSFTIAASTGYSISSVVVDGVSQGAVSSYSFSNVTTNHTIAATFSYNGYTITATAGTGGTITPSGAVPVLTGSNQSFSISANTGGYVTNVLVDGVSQGVITSFTFTNVTANHSISALFYYTNFTITASAGAGGAIAPSGSVLLAYGATQAYSITPNTGYAISNVVVDSVSQGAISSCTFTNVTANHTIAAAFNSVPALGGIISVNYCLANDVLAATAPAGAVLTNHWNSIIHDSSGTSYSNPTNAFYDCTGAGVNGFDVRLSTDSQASYSTYIMNNGGDYTASLFSEFALSLSWGGGSPATGTVAFTNIPYSQYDLYLYDIGYVVGAIVNYTIGGTTVTLTNNDVKYPLTPGGNYVKFPALTNQNPVVTVSYGAGAQYSQQGISAFQIVQTITTSSVYTITPTAGAGGTISPGTPQSVTNGSNATFAMAANTGYAISNVLVDGVSQGAVGSYTFTNVTASHTIAATFSNLQFTITASAGTGGLISPSGSVAVNYSSNQSFTITASTGYGISNVVVDGASQGVISSFAFNNVTANHAITATFTNNGAIDYTITASAGTGGSITPNGAVLVASGSNQSFTITASTGYGISNVVADGVSQGAVGSFAFNNVTTNHAITATFSNILFAITASAGTGGAISPTGNVVLAYGVNQTFAIAAGAGYAISNVVVDSVSQGAISSYTFTNVTASHAIAAAFRSAPALGNIISVNLGGGAKNVTQSVGAVAATNWNNLLGANPASGSALLDNSGAPTTLSLSTSGFNAASLYGNGNGSGGLSDLFNGYLELDYNNNSGTATVNLTNIPYASYNIYIYYEGYTANTGYGSNSFSPASTAVSKWTVSEGGQALYGQGGDNGGGANLADTWGCNLTGNLQQFQSATPPGQQPSAPNGAGGDYLVFAGLTATNQTITLTGVAGTGFESIGIAGLQIVQSIVVLPTYTITPSGGAGGTILPGTPQTVTNGNNATFTITANLGHGVSNVVVDGVSQGAVGSYTFTNVQAAHSIAAAFSNIVSTITASAGTGGLISPSGGVAVVYSSNQSFSITASTGYGISNVVVDSVSQGATNAYTFNNVTANHTINATFAVLPPMLSAANFTRPGGTPTFAVPNTVAGYQYTLGYKNSLADSSWIWLTGSGTAPGTGGAIILVDTNSINSLGQRFYRLQMQ